MRKRQPAGKPKITCSKCGDELEDNRKGKRRYCKKCHAAYMRANRPRHCELPEQARLKANARSYANQYLKRGKLRKKPCENCGDAQSQMHHDDYNQPLFVRWFCRKCHLEFHQAPLANPNSPPYQPRLPRGRYLHQGTEDRGGNAAVMSVKMGR